MTAVIIAIAASIVVYARGIAVIWREGSKSVVEPWRVAMFCGGQFALAIALGLDSLAATRFPAHMIQHEILLLVAPPLLALGRPVVALLRALPGTARSTRSDVVRFAAPWWRKLTNVVFLFTVHAAVTWGAHLPLAFNAALEHPVLHAIQHAVMLTTSVLFWWALVEGRYGRAGYGAAAVFVFGTSLHTGLLGAGFTFASTVVYAPYAQAAGAAGFDALRDQQLAGLLMWIPAGVLFGVAGLAFVAAWIGESEHRALVIARGKQLPLILILTGSSAGLLAGSPGRAQRAVTIAWHGPMTRDLQRGVDLGVREARAAAALIGREVTARPLRVSSDSDVDALILVRSAAEYPRQRSIPAITLGVAERRQDTCSFAMPLTDTTGPATRSRAVAWHHSLVKFGAAQLNERYRRAFGAPMTADSWTGWFAVKALAEVILANEIAPCDTMTVRRFDGHKGVPLTFSAATGLLRQPLYLVEQQAAGEVVKEVR
jgi:putative membrane protein